MRTGNKPASYEAYMKALENIPRLILNTKEVKKVLYCFTCAPVVDAFIAARRLRAPEGYIIKVLKSVCVRVTKESEEVCTGVIEKNIVRTFHSKTVEIETASRLNFRIFFSTLLTTKKPS